VSINEIPGSVKINWGQPHTDESPGLLIIPSVHGINETSIIDLSIEYLEQKKTVINLRELSKDNLKKLSNYPQFINYYDINKPWQYEKKISDNSPQEAKIVNIPIICVAGLIEGTHKLLLQYQLVNKLRSEGNNVFWLCSCGYPQFISADDSCIRDNTYLSHDVDDVYAFNTYIRDQIVLKKPDIIVIGVPGGIMALNDYIDNDFGFMFYKVTNAINIDYLMLTIPTNNTVMKKKDVVRLNNIVYYRFGLKPSVIVFTNHKLFFLHDGKNKRYNIELASPLKSPKSVKRIDDVHIVYTEIDKTEFALNKWFNKNNYI
jgi:hypothetical protein